MDKLLEAFTELLFASPAFKEKLNLAVTEIYEGIEVDADNISGFEAAVAEAVGQIMRDADFETTISFR